MPRNILQISFKKIVVILSGLVLIFAMDGCGGGGGGGDDPQEPDPAVSVIVSGTVDDGTPNSPISKAKCNFVDLNGVVLASNIRADGNGNFSINVLPDKEGHIRCAPPAIPRLILSTFLSTKGRVAGDKISGEDLKPATTIVAEIIKSENAAVPQARKLELLAAIENKDPLLMLLVDLFTGSYNAMLKKRINVFGGSEGAGGDGPGDAPGDGGDVGGDAGDGADKSPIPNARCDFALELEGEVLYNAALEDLRDGKLDRPDLLAIKEEVEEWFKDPETLEAFKKAFSKWLPERVGKPYSTEADVNGRFDLSVPHNVEGFVRCTPADQPQLKLATFVPKLEEGEIVEDQKVTPATTFFSHSIATKLSNDLKTVKKNYLEDTAGLGDIHIVKEGEEIIWFELLDTGVKDKDVGMVAFSATSLFNILYKNEIDVDYLAALDNLIDNDEKEVDPIDLVSIGISEEDAEKWSDVVNRSNDGAGEDLGTNLKKALSTARVNITVTDISDGGVVPGSKVNMTDAPGSVVCENCPAETGPNGDVILTLTGVPPDATEITIETSNILLGFKTSKVNTEVAAFATVDLKIELTPLGDIFTNSIGMTFRAIPAGTFMMGSPLNEPGRLDRELQHQVTLTQPFYMQTTEVTQAQWRAMMESNPSWHNTCGDDCPVENISWDDIQTFINQLNALGEGTYRLPTEAEWEYSARAGSTTAFANGDITELDCGRDPNLDAMGWYCYNSGDTPHPVAQKNPNVWGLYDMHGNIWEWVQDRYGDYPSDPVIDPTGPDPSDPSTHLSHVGRGASFNFRADYCRSAHRGRRTAEPFDGPDRWTGFRLVVNP